MRRSGAPQGVRHALSQRKHIVHPQTVQTLIRVESIITVGLPATGPPLVMQVDWPHLRDFRPEMEYVAMPQFQQVRSSGIGAAEIIRQHPRATLDGYQHHDYWASPPTQCRRQPREGHILLTGIPANGNEAIHVTAGVNRQRLCHRGIGGQQGKPPRSRRLQHAAKKTEEVVGPREVPRHKRGEDVVDDMDAMFAQCQPTRGVVTGWIVAQFGGGLADAAGGFRANARVVTQCPRDSNQADPTAVGDILHRCRAFRSGGLCVSLIHFLHRTQLSLPCQAA
ncbi:MAG: hypothetical protein BWY76_00902 [bacterium ADurb.Bin429]|nr:MAG: hypothetical protein BWY76_00902 [bacterium ADurb.Bin429]